MSPCSNGRHASKAEMGGIYTEAASGSLPGSVNDAAAVFEGPSLIWLVLRTMREVFVFLVNGPDRDGVANGIIVQCQKKKIYTHPRHDENASQ